MVRLAYPDLPVQNQNELIRQQFFNGLSYENQMESWHIGLENTVESILKKLKEIERYKIAIGTNIYSQPQVQKVVVG